MTARTFHGITLGESVSWNHEVTADEVDRFAELSGDKNPLHLSDAFAHRHGFRGRVVHGMLVSAFLSRVLGMELPGPGVLWLSQNTRFPQPVYVGDVIAVEVAVTHKSEALRTLVLSTTARNQRNEIVLTGEAKVMMLEAAADAENVPRVALVTGASRGIGAAIARALGARRAKVIVNYLKDKSGAENVLEAIAAEGGEGVALQADVATVEGAEQLAKAALERFGTVNVLVHNASPAITRKPLFEQSWDEIDRYWQTYVQGAFTLTRAFVPGMKQSGFGRIVNLLTIATAGNPPPDMAGYVAAKSGLWGLTKAMAVELASSGITVNAVSPAAVMTDQWSDIPETRRRALAMRNPMRRLAAPEDVVHAVLALVEAGGGYLTGVNIPVAGGEVLFP